MAGGFAMFALAGAVVWAALGLVLAALVPSTWALAIGVVGVLAYGGAQLLSRGAARVPQSSWQVPRAWLESRAPTGRLGVWAATLGPGLLTRNPYATFWVVVPALGSLSRPVDAMVVGALAGAAHGLARFGGVVLRQRTRPGTDWNLLAVLWNIRFQRVDGLLLLLLGTGLVVALLSAT